MNDRWKIIYHEYDPTQEQLREALFSLGNGYFVTRGAAEESNAGNDHY
jgi:trehalose/maltose hydrolase-like predicted phosphorylase